MSVTTLLHSHDENLLFLETYIVKVQQAEHETIYTVQ